MRPTHSLHAARRLFCKPSLVGAAPAAHLVTRSRPAPSPPSSWPSPLSQPAASIARLSTSAATRAKNQIYTPVRNTDSLQTYISISASSRTPLLTLWTASWCPTCRTVEPLLRSLVESGVGEEEGGVSLAPVEFDAPDIMSAPDNPGMTYMITSIPTLLSFDAGEAQVATKLTDARKLADPQFLAEWIRTEARRQGGRGGGGSSIFSGLFGTGKS